MKIHNENPPGYRVLLYIDEKLVTTKYAQQLSHAFASPDIAEYHQTKKQWNYKNLNSIDWDGLHSFLKTLPCHRSTKTSKWSTDGTSAWLPKILLRQRALVGDGLDLTLSSLSPKFTPLSELYHNHRPQDEAIANAPTFARSIPQNPQEDPITSMGTTISVNYASKERTRRTRERVSLDRVYGKTVGRHPRRHLPWEAWA